MPGGEGRTPALDGAFRPLLYRLDAGGATAYVGAVKPAATEAQTLSIGIPFCALYLPAYLSVAGI